MTLGCAGVFAGLLFCIPALAQDMDFTELEFEELLKVKVVTSVSKKPQKISNAPAAIHVITQEDIQRSGVTHIADALRMVPGMEVARINAHAWAISARGFNSYYAGKLLVLIDGRTLYTPEFSGVYWDVVDTLLDDIERIEVIRGPGGTLWGANAVNGVINIITKSAKDTQGGLVKIGGGNEQGFAAVRHGVTLDEEGKIFFRGYAKTSATDEFEHSVQQDGWELSQGGFRLDGEPDDETRWTVQGDVYHGSQDEMSWRDYSAGKASISGMNLLSRWERSYSEKSDLMVQAYSDYYSREIPVMETSNQTLDLELQHRYAISKANEFVWGLGYRMLYNQIPDRPGIRFDPSKRRDHLYSAFFQNDFKAIPDKLTLTLGSKFEHNDYTGLEIQPNARLLWSINEKQSFWAGISRAVRTPSRSNHDGLAEVIAPPNQNPYYPVPVIVRGFGDKDFESETVVAYELGLRNQVSPRLSWDVAGFYNNYDKLVAGQRNILTDWQNNRILVLQQGINGMHGKTYGLEVAMNWVVNDWWRIQTAYTFLDMDLELMEGLQASTAEDDENQSANHRLSVRSSMDLSKKWELDFWARHVSALEGEPGTRRFVDKYWALDLRLAWKATKNLELSLVGQNLLDKHHYEFVPNSFNPLLGEVERSLYFQARWQF